jgi:hypothetical protein
MNVAAECGAIPAKLLEKVRPMVIAGLANEVDEVKKYAAKIQAATPNATFSPLFIKPRR